LPTVTAYTSGKFHPHPPEAIRYVVVLANKNERIMESLIHELKRSGGLHSFLEGVMEHPESYGSLADLIGHDEHGPTRAKKLTRSMDDAYQSFIKGQEDMYESVAPPFGVEAEEDDEESHDDSETEVDNVETGDEMGTSTPSLGLDDEAPEGNEEPEADSHDDSEMDNDVPAQSNDALPPKKLKKRFAEDHLLDAMSGHERIMGKMKKYMQH
jgi:hypothetical protein